MAYASMLKDVLFFQSLAYFPFAIANALTARLDDGFVPRHLFLLSLFLIISCLD
jgi:hypothetical protein